MKASPEDEEDGGGEEFGDGLGPPVVVADVAAEPSGLVLTETAFVVMVAERRGRRRGAGDRIWESGGQQRELVEAMGGAEAAAADMARTTRWCRGLLAAAAAAAAGDEDEEAASDARMVLVREERARAGEREKAG